MLTFKLFAWEVILNIQKKIYVQYTQRIDRYKIKLRADLLPCSQSNGLAKVFSNLNVIHIIMYKVEENNNHLKFTYD